MEYQWVLGEIDPGERWRLHNTVTGEVFEHPQAEVLAAILFGQILGVAPPEVAMLNWLAEQVRTMNDTICEYESTERSDH